MSGGCQICAGRIWEPCYIFGINASGEEARYQGRHTSKGDKRSSTCSLPDEPYSFVIYGDDMIHDSPMYLRVF